MKSTVDEIRQRFSNLETGQSATVDAPLAMALVAGARHRQGPCGHAGSSPSDQRR
jgi:tRNA (cmo5U34)-methyltransferase